MVREGVQCYESVRKRFDGERRNPWDEPECGHHYARAMSAWSGIVALSGFSYRGSDKSVIAAPKARAAGFSSFWSTATGWGVFSQSNQDGSTRFSLSVLGGNLPCRSVEVVGDAVAGVKSFASLGQKSVAHQMRAKQKRLIFTFADSLELKNGDRLVLRV